MKALVKEQAQAFGAAPKSITTVNLCTICHEDLFFSYRRERKVNGTMVSAIGLPVSAVTLDAPQWHAEAANSPAYCSVQGSMAPVDKSATARPIRFPPVITATRSRNSIPR